MSSPVRTDSDHALDAQLLARVGQGDKEALGELYDRWSLQLQPLVAAAASDPAQIENALHDTFITLWQKAPDFDSHQTHAYDWAVEWIRASSTASANETQAPTTLPTDLPAPTAALRSRILNSAVPLPPEARYVLPFPTPPAWLGWVAASVFSFAALFFAAKSFNVRGELQSAIETERVTRLEPSSAPKTTFPTFPSSPSRLRQRPLLMRKPPSLGIPQTKADFWW
jgi:hypothetical protein